MTVIDYFPRDYDVMARKVAEVAGDRRIADKFCSEVDKMMEMRQLKWPMHMAADCVIERAKLLVAFEKVGWARVPAKPGEAVLVDKQGCVLTDLDENPIKPYIAAIVRIPAPNPPGSIATAFKLQVTSAEGDITHIYPDSEGHPTVGIGHHIEGEQDLLAIHERFGFYNRRDDGEPGAELADFEDVLKDYRQFEGYGKHDTNARAFRRSTSVDLLSGDVIGLRDQDIEVRIGEIQNSPQHFPHYLTYPLDAQLALLDMVFNRGMRRVKNDDRSFIEAIQNRNWKRAAETSSNVGNPSDPRQAEAKGLFMQAAAKEPYFIDPKCSKPILHVRDAMFL